MVNDIKYVGGVEFKEIKEIIEDNPGYYRAFMLGNDKSYTGIYSFKTHSRYDINFKGYKAVDNTIFLLYDYSKAHIYSLESNLIKSFNYESRNIDLTISSGNRYYYLSRNSNYANNKCIILDANYNTLFNSKQFEYAYIKDDRLYTYESENNKKKILVYSLDGNRINNNVNPDFNVIGYITDTYAIGILNNKITVVNAETGEIINDEIPIGNYKNIEIIRESEISAIRDNIKIDLETRDNTDEIVLMVYTDNNETTYYHYKKTCSTNECTVTGKKIENWRNDKNMLI